MGVDADEKRAVDSLLPAVDAGRLGDGEDVLFVERTLERCAAVARRSERDALRRAGGIGLQRVVVRHQPGNVG